MSGDYCAYCFNLYMTKRDIKKAIRMKIVSCENFLKWKPAKDILKEKHEYD